ncbi:PilW family protein [Lysobacter soli]|uniref:PilW family protein n=1 Tax=Lysobacter soli TaxID=453783 RepID=UPI0036A66627
MNRRHTSNARYATGLSLIELMIAMVIGLVLLLGLVQVMSASRNAYQLSTGVARTQENARFAVDFLQRDLRMAGHMGCINDQARMQTSTPATSDATREGLNLWFLTAAQRAARTYNALSGDNFPLRFDLGIQGFEAVNTAPGASRTLAAGTPVAANANQWSPALPTKLANLNPVAGSDILVVRFLSRDGVPATLTAVNATQYTILPDAYGKTVTTTEGTGLFGLADCGEASVFASDAVDAGTGQVTVNIGSPGLNASGMIDDGTQERAVGRPMLHRAEGYVYYVAAGSGRNVDGTSPPSLWRARMMLDGSDVMLQPEELVEGVESMQLLYGMDENLPDDYPRGNVERVRIASAVNATPTANPNNAQSDEWRRVATVQVGLLMRSADRATAEQAQRAPLVLGVQMNPASSDGFYRSVYETTVVLRNRMFGN